MSNNKKKNNASLMHKEQEFKDLNAALEEKTASLINDVESVLRGQELFFNDLHSTEKDLSDMSLGTQSIDGTEANTTEDSLRKPPAKKKLSVKKRPLSGPVTGAKKREMKQNGRPKTSINTIHGKETSPLNLVSDRAAFADRINTLEMEAADDLYTPSHLNEGVLPEAANELSSDATIRFLKAKLRVMQEELENVANECRQKASKVTELQSEMKESNMQQTNLLKKNEQLQKTIEKQKKLQTDLQTKNSDLESDVTSLKKELDGTKRSNKQSSANRNTLEVRLNRALEEVEKYKQALKKSKESTKAVNDTDRKCLDQLQNENKRLESQKNDLMIAFKKQLKLIDILKRQKMHIEAAKMLEFTEEEFIRALDWNNTT
ncbi:testis-expressed protein 9-like [Clytia hemisphaerica]|uniref:Uncharacterized protein n=1 Tax=Clytia hemisphaerica TaxID=252671 RepID=A0A7M5UTU7_9CNID